MGNSAQLYFQEEIMQNKTEVVIKLSVPMVAIAGFVCYKMGQYSVYIKAAKAVMNEEKNKKDE